MCIIVLLHCGGMSHMSMCNIVLVQCNVMSHMRMCIIVLLHCGVMSHMRMCIILLLPISRSSDCRSTDERGGNRDRQQGPGSINVNIEF